MVDNANDAIISTSKEGTIVSFNKKAEDMFGYARDEIVGKTCYSAIAAATQGKTKKDV